MIEMFVVWMLIEIYCWI